MNRAERLIAIFAIFGVVGAIAYWLYLYTVEGSAPSFGDLWNSAKGGFTSVTGIGKLSFVDLQTYASNAGFTGDDLNTACAIALAESSGNPNAVGDISIPGGSIGLWQVNLKAHPEYTASELTDPQTNANAAYAIYVAAGNSFSPWSTYNSNAYAQYLPSATGTSTTASSGSSDDTSTVASDVDDADAYDADGDDTDA